MSAPSFDLTDRVALVTGGSRGLGRSIALGLAASGADVIVASRDLVSCEATAAEVTSTTGRRALPVSCHVGDWAQLDALVETAYDELGRVDVLVNNAGMSPLYDRLTAVTEALWEKVFAVNVRAPFRLSALIGERMAAGAGGSIVNIGSIASDWPRPDAIPYGAAKAGVIHLTSALAFAYGPKVRVNCVQPGAFLTDIAADWDMEVFARHAEGLALRRGGTPDEIVGAVVYLASDASSYTTGATLRVDGGYWQPATNVDAPRTPQMTRQG
jgi:NAD(P)-dependent dehydrogenase (short-subunit alcohol dehydrogenase family)